MELVALLRVLWRFRIAVAVGFAVAIGCGYMVTRAPGSRVGVASMRVLVDTARSQTVDVEPAGAATLDWRTGFFADMAATAPTRRRIARDMGIPMATLGVTAPHLSAPVVRLALPRAAADTAAAPQAYQL